MERSQPFNPNSKQRFGFDEQVTVEGYYYKLFGVYKFRQAKKEFFKWLYHCICRRHDHDDD